MIPSVERGPAAPDSSALPPDFSVNLARTSTSKDLSPNKPFTDRDLYGPSGPRPEDVRQDGLGDCHLLASLAAFAQQQPQLIQNQIMYDSKTGNFQVTLYRDPDPKNPNNPHQWVTIQVTQDDVRNNIARGGGSTVDNSRKGSGPIWPSVMETAQAKMLDGNHADGLDQGYNALHRGGIPANAMETITGRPASNESVAPMTAFNEMREGPLSWAFDLSGVGIGARLASDYRYNEISNALAEGRPVTLGTTPQNHQDGLVSRHAYQVESIRKDASGDIEVTVRNPWGRNDIGETPGSSTNPVMTVKLASAGAGLSYFSIGPSPQETGVS